MTEPTAEQKLECLLDCLLRAYEQSVRMKEQCEHHSPMWWWAEGRMITAENCLLGAGVEVDE